MARVLATAICGDSSGYGYTFFISTSGDVYYNGMLEHKGSCILPTQIPSLPCIQSVDCGDYHTICLGVNGNLFSFGYNDFGQLGIGKPKEIVMFAKDPQQVNLPPILQISCGSSFTLCLDESGFIHSFGINTEGQLGLGHTTNVDSPQRIESLLDVEFVECGSASSFCKITNDSFYLWGSNKYGRLGLESVAYLKDPLLCSKWPKDIVDLKCGGFHMLALTSNGDVYSGGNCLYNKHGKGDSIIHKADSLSNIIRIECGYQHAMCIDIDNNLFVFGLNTFYQLGSGDKKNILQPIKHPTLSNIIDISKGGTHTFVKTSDNEIYAFGKNTNSQLGIETPKKVRAPVRVFQGIEDIWCSNVLKSKAKSARFVV